MAFENDVEAARLGTAFAANGRAYRKWRRAFDSSDPGRKANAVSGPALEAAVARIGAMFPGQVTRVTA